MAGIRLYTKEEGDAKAAELAAKADAATITAAEAKVQSGIADSKATTARADANATASALAGQMATVINPLKSQADTLTQSVSDINSKLSLVKRFYSGTSTQTVTNVTQVLIPHGIPLNESVRPSARTPKLNAETDVSSNYVRAYADDTNIVVEYDVAIISTPNGWVMKWEL